MYIYNIIYICIKVSILSGDFPAMFDDAEVAHHGAAWG